MASWIDDEPEYEPIKHGDPFLAEIVKADDIIDDHAYHADVLGVTPAEAARTIAWAKREQLSFELATLYAWWAK